MDLSQYIDYIRSFIVIIFVLLAMDSILKVITLEKTFAELFIRIGVAVGTVLVGYTIVTNVI